jgi:hypothetical protein
MKRTISAITTAAATVVLAMPAHAQGAKPLTKCAPDAVVAGTVCMDRFEASVWRVPAATVANKGLVKKIRAGKATLADLAKGGATQLGIVSDDYAPCADNGQNCVDDIYAVSLAGVVPSAFVTWFQAHTACANAGKRLPSSTEWQGAVVGTPDAGPDDGVADCNTFTFAATSTGARSRCVSSRGAFDMVGNLKEWVSDWVPKSNECGSWSAGVSPTGDRQCLIGVTTGGGDPGALLRGGANNDGGAAGPLALDATGSPSLSLSIIGFRCAR